MIIVGKKWDTGAQYIGRGSVLGNPFEMKNDSDEERDRVCDCYQVWFDDCIKRKDPVVLKELRRLYRLAKNGDLTLGCFCAPKRCHGLSVKSFLDSQLKKVA